MPISKKQITEVQKLHQKKFREQEQQFIVEGTKSVLEVIGSDWKISSLFALSGWIEEHHLKIQDIEYQEVTLTELERISCLKTPQSVLAVVQEKDLSTSSIREGTPLLILDDIRDPGNLGTIIRTADWFGIQQILCSPDTVEYTNPKVIQASMGSFLRVAVFYRNLPEYLREVHGKRPIFGSFMDGEDVKNVPFSPQDILVIGNEGRGISEEILPFISQKVTIPYSGEQKTESLNASIATAILLYEMRKG